MRGNLLCSIKGFSLAWFFGLSLVLSLVFSLSGFVLSVSATSVYDNAYTTTQEVHKGSYDASIYGVVCPNEDLSSTWTAKILDTTTATKFNNGNGTNDSANVLAIQSSLRTALQNGSWAVTQYSHVDNDNVSKADSVKVWWVETGQLQSEFINGMGNASTYPNYNYLQLTGATLNSPTMHGVIISMDNTVFGGNCQSLVTYGIAGATNGAVGRILSTSQISPSPNYNNFIYRNLFIANGVLVQPADGSYAGVTIPQIYTPPVPPDTIGFTDWDFTAKVDGLKVRFSGDGIGPNPATKFEWDFLYTGTFTDYNPSGATTTDANSQTPALYSWTIPAGSLDQRGVVSTVDRIGTSQYLDYTFPSVGEYDVGMIVTSTTGITKYTHQKIIVGGTGFFRTSGQNGFYKVTQQKSCGDLYPINGTDLFYNLGLNIGCQISNFFTPDLDLLTDQWFNLQATFNKKMGVVAYGVSFFPTFFARIQNSPMIANANGCSVSLGQNVDASKTFLKGNATINFCALEQTAPTVWGVLVNAIRWITVFVVFVGLYYKGLGFLNGNHRKGDNY